MSCARLLVRAFRACASLKQSCMADMKESAESLREEASQFFHAVGDQQIQKAFSEVDSWLSRNVHDSLDQTYNELENDIHLVVDLATMTELVTPGKVTMHIKFHHEQRWSHLKLPPFD